MRAAFWLQILQVWLACFGHVACEHSAPDASKPWTVVLDETPTREGAQKLVEIYAKKPPDQIKSVFTRSLEDDGGVRHLVVSQGFETRQEAHRLAQLLGQSHALRLEVVNTTRSLGSEDNRELGWTVPAQGESFERLASMLPKPASPDLRLESYWMQILTNKNAQAPTRSFGYGRAHGVWSLAFGRLGFSATAQAVYRLTGTGSLGSKRIFVFVGRLEKESSQPEQALGRISQFLMDYVRPAQEKSGPIKTSRLMPWGQDQVNVVERVAWTKRRDKAKTKETLKTAWIAWTPIHKGVMLVLWEHGCEKATTKLLTPTGLGKPHGMAYLPVLSVVWRLLPEVAIEGERLAYLGMHPLLAWLDTKRKKSFWAKRLGGYPVHLAGYLSASTNWQVSWIDLGSEPDAKTVFEAGYVAPRQEMIQRKVLKRRRKLGYQVRLRLHDVGDVQGWHLSGSQNGRLQELYFQKGSGLWLIQCPANTKNSFEIEDLVARAGLLQIWDQP